MGNQNLSIARWESVLRDLMLLICLATPCELMFGQSLNKPGTVSISIDPLGLFFGSLGIHVEYRLTTGYALGLTSNYNYDSKAVLKEKSDIVLEPFLRYYGTGTDQSNWNLGVELYSGIAYEFQHQYLNYIFGCGFTGNYSFLPYVFVNPSLDVQLAWGHDPDTSFRLKAPVGLYVSSL